jgi:hypothetical protein
MPIKRDRRHLYGPPKVWDAIARSVKDAAHWMCKNCGATHGMPHPTNGKRTVVTVAHLDHNETNCALSNLRSLCAPCHLAYDAAHHAKNAAATRRAKRASVGS